MPTRTLSLLSLRTLLSPAALALPLAMSLAACDGVEDEDQGAFAEVIADDDDEPARSEDEPEIEAEDIADADADADAESYQPGAPIELSDSPKPTAWCAAGTSVPTGGSVTLKDSNNVTYGVVKIVTGNWGCTDSYAVTEITNGNVSNFSREHRIRVDHQYWTTGGYWASVTPLLDTGYTTLSSLYSLTTPQYGLAATTYVRACGRIESAWYLGDTLWVCTPAFKL